MWGIVVGFVDKDTQHISRKGAKNAQSRSNTNSVSAKTWRLCVEKIFQVRR
jgi:hypothetical protein